MIFMDWENKFMNIGFIGVGKIAGAIVEGLSSVENMSIWLSPRNEGMSKELAEKYPAVTRLGSNQEVLDRCDIIFIALRPPVAVEVLSGLIFQEKHIVISLVPLLKYAELVRVVSPARQVSRAIPLPSVRHHQCPIPIFRSNETVTRLLNHIGQPLLVEEEGPLHAIWTLTGLITPFYDLLNTLSGWTISHGVEPAIAGEYIANLFQSLSYEALQSMPIEYGELAGHAETPGGMNAQAGREIREKGGHEIYRIAADHLLERFK
jgi:pyrroline-5-carboxylate reductase